MYMYICTCVWYNTYVHMYYTIHMYMYNTYVHMYYTNHFLVSRLLHDLIVSLPICYMYICHRQLHCQPQYSFMAECLCLSSHETQCCRCSSASWAPAFHSHTYNHTFSIPGSHGARVGQVGQWTWGTWAEEQSLDMQQMQGFNFWLHTVTDHPCIYPSYYSIVMYIYDNYCVVNSVGIYVQVCPKSAFFIVLLAIIHH